MVANNTKTTQQKYVLDLSQIKPFDIILTRDQKLQSQTIQKVTKGSFSHAGIFLDSTSFIDATRERRVFTNNPQRLSFENINDCKILRINIQLSEKQKENLNIFLRQLVGSEYSILEAIRTIKYSTQNQSALNTKQFCSRLVAQAFEHINIKIVSNPDFCSPNDIDRSQHVLNIENILKPATADDLYIINDKEDLVQDNMNETYKWIDKASDLIHEKVNKMANIRNEADVALFLEKYPKYDHNICEYLLDTNYLYQYQKDIIANPPRYAFISGHTPSYERELRGIISIYNHHLKNYQSFSYLYKKQRLKFFKHLKLLHLNIIKLQQDKANILRQYIVHNKFHNQTIQTNLSNFEKVFSKMVPYTYIEEKLSFI